MAVCGGCGVCDGRLLKEKGIREFIDASRIVLKTTKNVEFIILGGIDPSNPSSLSQQQLDNILCGNILTLPRTRYKRFRLARG